MNPHIVTANAIRALSMDGVQQAKSGHPGAPMGMADMAAVLWRRHLRVNPKNPEWHNRDRFVLSNGHASMLLYSLLHLSGFELSLDEIKRFRQLHSKTPGHPEVHETPGVETTSGPLGQGIANAVGFAIAEAHLGKMFNREGHLIVDHNTYCFLGDGCLMEGVSHEACSLAGTLGLGKLIVLYDANGISIDGKVDNWFGEDVAKRFDAYGWQVIGGLDGHDPEAIDQAIKAAKTEAAKPSLIICRTKIGFGSPRFSGSEKCHGAPLGEEEILATKKALGLPLDTFAVPEGAYEAADLRAQGAAWESEWQARYAAYAAAYPDLARHYARIMAGKLPEGIDQIVTNAMRAIQQAGVTVATRKASEQALDIIAPELPELFGGSADLTGSNNTLHKRSEAVTPGAFSGNYLHYGVREFAMGAIMNGMCLHRGIRPYGGTFLVFSDYMRNAIRLSALMKLPVTYVLTHDSIGLGEDGPTHQPIEHLASLRLMPNLHVWRPCDSVETLVAWRSALEDGTPTVLALSRQGLPVQPRGSAEIEAIARGGYVLREADQPDVTLIATGSEVELAMQAVPELAQAGVVARVVSMPCVEIFERQPQAYQSQVLLTDGGARLAIEAGVGRLWKSIVGTAGDVLGIETFGLSAPANELFQNYGFTVAHVVSKVKALLER